MLTAIEEYSLRLAKDMGASGPEAARVAKVVQDNIMHEVVGIEGKRGYMLEVGACACACGFRLLAEAEGSDILLFTALMPQHSQAAEASL